MRRYDERVEVREGTTEWGPGRAIPEAFVWRGRLYLVRAVLNHWRQRTAWWRAVAGTNEVAPVWLADPNALEEEVWRVEAAPGRLFGTGVYDLARGSGWRLLRVAD